MVEASSNPEHYYRKARPRALAFASLLAAVALVAVAVILPAAPASAVSESTATSQIVADTNAHRSRNGLSAIIRNSSLDAVARAWSFQQCAAGAMSHNPSFSDQIPAGWSRAGENVAVGYVYTAVTAAWIASPGHNANLLGDYTHIGVGYCDGSNGRFYTQVFAKYSRSMPGDFSSVPAIAPGMFGISSGGDLRYYPANGSGGFGTASLVGTGWSSMSLVTGVGDLTGDGTVDLVARASDNRLRIYPGVAGGGFSRAIELGPGWGTFNDLIGVGDLTGDGRPDMLARNVSGQLFLYPGTAAGRLGAGVQIGRGWASMTALVGPGDITSDGISDLVARDADGDLWVYPGTSSGGLGSRSLAGTSWQGFDAIVSPGDISGDGRPDLVGRASGLLYLYTSTRAGTFTGLGQVGHGWTGLTILGPGAIS